MRHALAGLLLVAVASTTAHADDHKWEAIFVGSAAVAFGGATLYWHGLSTIDHAEHNLCTGDYRESCDRQPPRTSEQLDRFNNRGEEGVTMVRVGGVMLLAGGALALVSAYKAFISKNDEPEREPTAMKITPTVTPESAGATLSLRW
jgi:hypothetical protein